MTAGLGIAGRREAHGGPWPALRVDERTWRGVSLRLAADDLSLLALWGDSGSVRMVVMGEAGDAAMLVLPCPDGRYPSVGAVHPPAIRLERALFDLHGLVAEGAVDTRPWLDHGRWAQRHPLGRASPSAGPAPYAFLAAEGESLHQIPVGPVHAGIIEPGHFRFTASGETVVRLEERLGYVHRGVEGLIAGAPIERAARLAARVSGDSTVAYAIAFARAVEAALGMEAPPRAAWLRALMAELERLANHLGDIGAICNDASFSLMHAHTGVLREGVLRAADRAFGHRLMMDVVVPGGVAVDASDASIRNLGDLATAIRTRVAMLTDVYDDTASLQDRTVSTGFAAPELVARFAAGGFVGRASGRDFDVRRAFAYPPYDRLAFEVPVRSDGDVNARVWIRLDEVNASLSLIEQILTGLPSGAVLTPLSDRSGEGSALVEGFRGDVLAWVRIAGGLVQHAHLRDPSWFQWPLLEACIEGSIVADFPLCNKSFNCSYAGVDL
ncbi:MAG: NADH-quinone oxidoreductase subunit C [Caulobacterales bacterium]